MRIQYLMVTLCALVFNPSSLIAEEKDKSEQPPPSYTIVITDPKNEQTFQNGQDSISVSVMVEPQLQKGDTVSLMVDGSSVGEPAETTSFSVPRLERGTHTLQAKVNQKKGDGATSETITINQHRATKNSS